MQSGYGKAISFYSCKSMLTYEVQFHTKPKEQRCILYSCDRANFNETNKTEFQRNEGNTKMDLNVI